MVPSVAPILQRCKTTWAAQLQPDAIHTAWQDAGSTSWRDRLLHPVTTVQMFLLQIRHGHTACRHRPHFSGRLLSSPLVGADRRSSRVPQAFRYRPLPLRYPSCWGLTHSYVLQKIFV
jgi:hypothetical protein